MDALREIHRILAPHGSLALVWNAEDYNSPQHHKASSAWEAQAHELVWQVSEESGDDVPRYRHMEWKKIFDEQVKKTPLSLIIADQDQLFSLPIAEHKEPFQVALPAEQCWGRFATLGCVAVLEGERLEKTKKTFMDAISASDVDKDADGNIIMHGYAHVAWTTKIPSEGRESLTEVASPPA